MKLLVVNTGSTSVKIDSYIVDGNSCAHQQHITLSNREPHTPLQLLEQRFGSSAKPFDAIAHRVVHGGDELPVCTEVNHQSLSAIERWGQFAPLHNPAALRWIHACSDFFRVPQAIVSDTGFFRDLPAVASHYALPADLAEHYKIKRYGFHGTAHQFMLQQWQQSHANAALKQKLITVQLGGGCSISAIQHGRPIDTSMGFSPGEGLMMSSRCGELDIEAALYLMQQEHLDHKQLSALLNQQSGLLGVSGKSADLRELIHDESKASQFAITLFCYRIKKYIGAYGAALNGIDGIIIGGGIGEHQPAVRNKIFGKLDWLGIELDTTRNEALIGESGIISSDASKVEIRVAIVDENELIAQHTYRLLSAE